MIQLPIVFFDIHRICNQRCPYCVTDVTKSRSFGKIIEPEGIKYIKRFFRNRGPYNIVFTGGEPLITPGISECFRYLTNSGHKISIQTNLKTGVDLITESLTPRNMGWVLASFHPEAIKHIDRFIHHAEILARQGYPLVVKMILSKEVLGVLEDVYDSCRQKKIGVMLSPQIEFIKNQFDRPISYSPQDWARIAPRINLLSSWLYFSGGFYSRNRKCFAGSKHFYVRMFSENISGCAHSFPKVTGNFYNNVLDPIQGPVSCGLDQCICDYNYYSGIIDGVDDHERFMKLMQGENHPVSFEEFQRWIQTNQIRPVFDLSPMVQKVSQVEPTMIGSEIPVYPLPVERNISIPESRKYLSVVVTSRNDDHGGNTLHRTQKFTQALIEQCKKYNLDTELIFVEWNPPQDRPRLYEVLDWPRDFGPVQVRFIEVPPEIHHQIGNSDKFPLFQMIAKNVGIRRAKGEFVLATNIDVLLNDDLMQFLASGRLRQNCYYRIDRHDTCAKTIPDGLNAAQMIEYCRERLTRIHGLYGTKDVAEVNGDHYTYGPRDTRLHTNACGDFTLFAREMWHRVRAYPELPYWSFYVDSILLHMAHVAGLKQVILPEPMRIYHIEHDIGYKQVDKTMQERPSLDWHRHRVPWCNKMLETDRILTCNDNNWGFADRDLHERIIKAPRELRNADAQRVPVPANPKKRMIESVPKGASGMGGTGSGRDNKRGGDMTQNSDLNFNFLFEAEWGWGCFIEDYLLLAGILIQIKPKRMLEIGTHSGLGAVLMAKAASFMSEPAHVTSIDIDQSRGRSNLHLVPGIESEITFIEGSSNDILPGWIQEGRRFDLIFIDGAHDYEQASKDWNHSQKLSDVYVLHDTTQFTGLQQLVREIRYFNEYDVFQFVAPPGHRVKPDLRREHWSTGLTLVQKRSRLVSLHDRAHRDHEGNLLPGHSDQQPTPKQELLYAGVK